MNLMASKHRDGPPLKTNIVRNISEIPAGDWNKVFPDVLESYDFYRTLDGSGLEQFTFYYLMVYDGEAPVGAATCFLMRYPLDTSIVGPLKRMINSVKKRMPGILSIKTLICGMPIGLGRMGITGDTGAVMDAILGAMEEIAAKNGAAILAFKDFDKSYSNALDPLRERGFSRFDSLPFGELDVRFKDFEEYMKSLSGATRYDLKRKFRKADNLAPVELEIAEELEEGVLRDVYRLYLDMVAKHDMGFELLTIDFFRNVSLNMPGRVKFFLWRIKGKLAAFQFCLVSKEIMIDYYVGFDYSVAREYHLYFVGFRDSLNWCISHGVKKYEIGATGYEPKRRLDFDFRHVYLYIKFRNRMLRPFFNLMCQFLKFENFDPDLRKAKEKKPS
ncbi:MAG: GNAT family N-acetyltransferase [Candidatus Omnitrophota bacterium]